MNKKINNLCKILITSLGTISAISLTGTKIALENDGSINSFLGVQETVYTPNENADEQDTEYYKSKFDNIQDVIDNGRNLNRLVQQEGSVLLKNDNNALPLKEGNRKVSLVGVSSVDPAFSGTGSGSVDTSDAPSFKKAMENAGFEVNDTLWNFYSDNLDTYKRPNPSSVGGPVNVYNFQSFNYGTGDASWNDVNSNCGSSFSEYGDAAIYTITRIGGESHDIPSGLDSARKHDYNKTSINEDGDYLDLSDTEVDALKGLKDLKDQKKIKNTVLIINSPNPMETDFLLDPELGIDACLWIGTPGTMVYKVLLIYWLVKMVKKLFLHQALYLILTILITKNIILSCQTLVILLMRTTKLISQETNMAIVIITTSIMFAIKKEFILAISILKHVMKTAF